MRSSIVLAAVAFSAAPLGGQQLDEYEPIGDVVYGMKRDAMTDEEIRMVLASSQDDDVSVFWSCREGQSSTSITLTPGLARAMVTAEDGSPEVQYRVDKEEPVGPSSWSAGG